MTIYWHATHTAGTAAKPEAISCYSVIMCSLQSNRVEMWICRRTKHQVKELLWGCWFKHRAHMKSWMETHTHTQKHCEWLTCIFLIFRHTCMSTHSDSQSLKSCFGVCGFFFKKRQPLTNKHWGDWSSTVEPALITMVKSSTNTQHVEGLWWRELLWQPWTMRGRQTGEERRIQRRSDRAEHGQRLQNRNTYTRLPPLF